MVKAVINISTYTKDDQTYTKLFLIKSLSDILTTACKNHLVLEVHDDLHDVCQLLIKTCQSGELLQISYALDAFYEIFSEEYYDQILKSQSVIDSMESGMSALFGLFKTAKKQKTYSKHELGQIENALENIEPFIEYKKKEFAK